MLGILKADGKYKTIYADPPWEERGGGKCVRGAQKNYPLMATSEIKELAIPSIAEENCHLYLWVTNNFLPDGLEVANAWGFRYITVITWVKGSLGLGQYFRGTTEQCLFCVRGVLPYRNENSKRSQGITAIFEQPTIHSRKPEAMRTMIMMVSYAPRIELFARGSAPGWDRWPNHDTSTPQRPLIAPDSAGWSE